MDVQAIFMSGAVYNVVAVKCQRDNTNEQEAHALNCLEMGELPGNGYSVYRIRIEKFTVLKC